VRCSQELSLAYDYLKRKGKGKGKKEEGRRKKKLEAILVGAYV
jgi:hypothetical protein